MHSEFTSFSISSKFTENFSKGNDIKMNCSESYWNLIYHTVNGNGIITCNLHYYCFQSGLDIPLGILFVPELLLIWILFCQFVCEMVNEKECRHSPCTVVMWFGEILCGGSGGYFPASDGCAWVVSEVISVEFDYSVAPIQAARHHNASPSVTHNNCVPLELVIFVFTASSAPVFLTSQVLTGFNGLSF